MQNRLGLSSEQGTRIRGIKGRCLIKAKQTPIFKTTDREQELRHYLNTRERPRSKQADGKALKGRMDRDWLLGVS